jgi:hypothetical protein
MAETFSSFTSVFSKLGLSFKIHGGLVVGRGAFLNPGFVDVFNVFLQGIKDYNSFDMASLDHTPEICEENAE